MIVGTILMMLVGLTMGCALRGDTTDSLAMQTTCPIMGGKIDKNLHVDANGERIYVCCPACLDKVKANPQEAVATLKARGETVEAIAPLCKRCGERKGLARCCSKSIAKCSKCGLHKGAPGCCQLKPPGAAQ